MNRYMEYGYKQSVINHRALKQEILTMSTFFMEVHEDLLVELHHCTFV